MPWPLPARGICRATASPGSWPRAPSRWYWPTCSGWGCATRTRPASGRGSRARRDPARAPSGLRPCRLRGGGRIEDAREHRAVRRAFQRNAYAQRAACGHLQRLAALRRLHAFQAERAVARGVDDFQPVAQREAVLGLHLGPAVAAGHHLAHEQAAQGLRAAGVVVLQVLCRPALQEAGRVAPVCQSVEFGQHRRVEGPAGHRVVDGTAVHLGGARHVVAALGAAFDLEGVHADAHEPVHVLHRAQVAAVEDVGAVLVFHHRQQLAGAFLFFEQVGAVGQRMAGCAAAGREGAVGPCLLRLGIEAAVQRQRTDLTAVGGVRARRCRIAPAAGIGAGSLVGIAAVEVARKQATAGVGDAQCAVHEHLQLDVRALLPDALDLVQAQLAREDDARQAHALPELHGHRVHRVGLHREVDGHPGPALAHQHDEARVGHDERVGPQGDHRLDVAQVGAHLVVVRQQVAGHEEFAAARMRLADALADLLESEFVVARAQGIARLARIDGVGAEIVGRAHPVEGAGGQQQFGRAERHGEDVEAGRGGARDCGARLRCAP